MPIRHTTTGTIAVVLVALFGFSAPAAAASSIDLTNPAFAPVLGPTSIPIGHSDFCKVYRDECATHERVVEVMELDQARWDQLVSINNDVNRRITAITDQDLYRLAEFWTYPDDGYGDCEDFALAKRRELIAAGWEPSTLLMTVVRESNGNGHAVLMVRTDRGDLVLDNQVGAVMLWADTPYQFLKRQSQTHAGQWVGIDDGRMVDVITATTR